MLITIIFVRKRWLLWSCLFYFLSAGVCSAQIILKDKARIRNLGVLKGNILSYDANGRLIFIRENGDTLYIPADKVMSVKVMNALKVKEKGDFWHSVELGFNWGRANSFSSITPAPYLESNHAYVVSRYVQPGAGIGYQLQDEFHILPVFASLTGQLTPDRNTWFYFTNVGYGFLWERSNWGEWGKQYDEVKGGVLWHIGGGIRILGRNNATYLKAGFKMQKGQMGQPIWSGYRMTDRTFRKFYAGVAWAF